MTTLDLRLAYDLEFNHEDSEFNQMLNKRNQVIGTVAMMPLVLFLLFVFLGQPQETQYNLIISTIIGLSAIYGLTKLAP